jgi:hypothetical protein
MVGLLTDSRAAQWGALLRGMSTSNRFILVPAGGFIECYVQETEYQNTAGDR